MKKLFPRTCVDLPHSLADLQISRVGPGTNNCFRRTLIGAEKVALLRATGVDVRLLDSECCGKIGPFTFEKEKYEASQTFAE
jgi:hypothetical protein